MPAQRLIKAPEAAKIIGVTQSALSVWRFAGRGPAYYRDPSSNRVFYDAADCRTFRDTRQDGRRKPKKPRTKKKVEVVRVEPRVPA